MKRLGLTLVAAVCLTAGAFAAGNQPTTAKWEGNINVNKLGKYLNSVCQSAGRSYKHLRLLQRTDVTCRKFKEKSGKVSAQCSVRQLEIDEKDFERKAIC